MFRVALSETVCLGWKPSQFDEKRKATVEALDVFTEKMELLQQYTKALHCHF